MALAPEILREQMARRDRSEFADLIETPAVGAVTFPANARFALRSVSGNAAGVTAATVTGPSTRTIKVPALAAGQRSTIHYAEAGSVVTPEAGFDVLLDNGLGRLVKIGGA